MTTTEKLTRIRARCVELLELSEKRTLGKWRLPENDKAEPARRRSVEFRGGLGGWDLEYSVFGNWQVTPITNGDVPNAAYIAACAGAAEAGWKATIAAIDGLTNPVAGYPSRHTLDAILAAWPEDLV